MTAFAGHGNYSTAGEDFDEVAARLFDFLAAVVRSGGSRIWWDLPVSCDKQGGRTYGPQVTFYAPGFGHRPQRSEERQGD